jgi:predicted AAA+ superfamily ATPase
MFPTGYEVDFYLPETRQLIQVAQNLENPATRTWETQAMAEAMQTLNLSRGLILSDANAQSVEDNGLTIDIRSVAEWLMNE